MARSAQHRVRSSTKLSPDFDYLHNWYANLSERSICHPPASNPVYSPSMHLYHKFEFRAGSKIQANLRSPHLHEADNSTGPKTNSVQRINDLRKGKSAIYLPSMLNSRLTSLSRSQCCAHELLPWLARGRLPRQMHLPTPTHTYTTLSTTNPS